MSHKSGTSVSKDESICMVVGCVKKAIYKNATSHLQGVRRGYCSKHRHLAVCAKGYDENVLRHIDFREHRGDPE